MKDGDQRMESLISDYSASESNKERKSLTCLYKILNYHKNIFQAHSPYLLLLCAFMKEILYSGRRFT
jgi:hypothetical protein